MVRPAVVAWVLLAAACGAAQDTDGGARETAPEGAPTAVTQSAAAAVAPPEDVATDAPDVDADTSAVERSLRPVVDEAVRDLASRSGAASDAISVVLAQRVIWPDATLGCPLRGDERIGGPQPGARVHLEVGGRVYRYHMGGTRDEPFLCDPRAAKSEEYNDRIEP